MGVRAQPSTTATALCTISKGAILLVDAKRKVDGATWLRLDGADFLLSSNVLDDASMWVHQSIMEA